MSGRSSFSIVLGGAGASSVDGDRTGCTTSLSRFQSHALSTSDVGFSSPARRRSGVQLRPEDGLHRGGDLAEVTSQPILGSISPAMVTSTRNGGRDAMTLIGGTIRADGDLKRKRFTSSARTTSGPGELMGSGWIGTPASAPRAQQAESQAPRARPSGRRIVTGMGEGVVHAEQTPSRMMPALSSSMSGVCTRHGAPRRHLRGDLRRAPRTRDELGTAVRVAR